MVLCYKNPWKLIQADSSLGIRIRAGLVRGVQSSFSKTQRREERSKQNEDKENVRRKLSIQRGSGNGKDVLVQRELVHNGEEMAR